MSNTLETWLLGLAEAIVIALKRSRWIDRRRGKASQPDRRTVDRRHSS
jgi:hypothetical protein